MEPKFIENFASKFLTEAVCNYMFDSRFLWELHDATSQGDAEDYCWIDDDHTFEQPQLVHMFKTSEPASRIISPLIYNLMELVDENIVVDRVKANILLPAPVSMGPNYYHRPHVDYPGRSSKTLLYYVNDSDGDTVIFNKRFQLTDEQGVFKHPGELDIQYRFTPKAGSAILFDSDCYHASTPPSTGKRCVINIVFFKKSEAPPVQTWILNPDAPPPIVPGLSI